MITEGLPARVEAGVTVQFTRSLTDFQPADGWGYKLYLNGATQVFNKAATVVDGVFQVELLATDTAALLPGRYRYAERFTNSGTGEVVDFTGNLYVDVNSATAPAGAFTSWEERTLAVVEAALTGRLTSDIQAYQIAGRSVSKIPIKELRAIRGELRFAIWRQTNGGGLGIPYRVEFGLEPDAVEFPPTWQDISGLA